MRVSRPGHTVIELLIALAVGALVIALGASIGFRHQRFHRDIGIVVERSEQLEQIAALLPVSLRSVAAGEGDIAPGAARDTSLEFRATTMSGVACDSSGATVVIAPGGTTPRLSSVLARPESGDTAWVLRLLPATEYWVPLAITSVFDSLVVCRIGGAMTFGSTPRTSIALRVGAGLMDAPVAVRVTRPWRYSIYRASGGGWYLGAKDWNPEQRRFNTIQPIAGPLLSAAAAGLRFSYADSVGQPQPPGTPDTHRIAMIEVTLRGDTTIPGAYAHAVSFRGRSTTVVALRNRR